MRAESSQAVTFSDFAAFVIAAAFVVAVFVAPFICAWHYLDSHFSRMAEHDSRPLAEGSGLVLPGAPNAPSRPRIAVLHTGEKGGAMLPSSGLEDCSPALGEVVGSLQGEREASNRGQSRKPPSVLPTTKPARWSYACRGESERLSRPELEHSLRVSIRGSGLPRPGILRSTMGRERGASAQAFRAFEDGAAWSLPGINPLAKPYRAGTYLSKGGEDTLMTLTEKPAGPETDAMALSSHRPTARGVSGERELLTRMELGRAGIKPGRHLQTLANAAASLCGIDPALFWSLILRESSGRHWDAEGRVLRSSSNALGLGQIKASTARGVSPHLDPLKPWDNAVASACHLRSLLDANRGNVRKSLHDYHAGAYRKRTTAATLAYAADIIQGSAQ